MSRTDVHAPAWVKERDPLWKKNYIESHNHSWYVVDRRKDADENGHIVYSSVWKRVERCDLDVYLAANGFIRTACQIRFVYTGRNIHCGCNLCTGGDGRRWSRRADRQSVKRLLRSSRWDNIGDDSEVVVKMKRGV